MAEDAAILVEDRLKTGKRWSVEQKMGRDFTRNVMEKVL